MAEKLLSLTGIIRSAMAYRETTGKANGLGVTPAIRRAEQWKKRHGPEPPRKRT
jgi:hypothetical protein